MDWREVFGNDQPVEVEIGIGKGRFLIDAASRQPAVNFVGVEWAAKYLRIACQRAARRNLDNVRFAHMDARGIRRVLRGCCIGAGLSHLLSRPLAQEAASQAATL